MHVPVAVGDAMQRLSKFFFPQHSRINEDASTCVLELRIIHFLFTLSLDIDASHTFLASRNLIGRMKKRPFGPKPGKAL